MYAFKPKEEKEKLKALRKEFENKQILTYGPNWKEQHRKSCLKVVIN